MTSTLSISGLLIATVLAAGCASTDQVAANDKPLACQREYRVGSNIPTRDCRPAMTDEERRQMIDQTRDSARSVPTAKPPGT